MLDPRYTVIVTGAAGNLGLRLLPQLSDFSVFGVDIAPPQTSHPIRFERMDLGRESSCRQLVQLLRETGAENVVHLAFVIDPVRTGVLDVKRMWEINVAGTARVAEAITEVNRMGGKVRKFIFPSSVSAYGPDLPGPVKEDHPLGAHTLPYAIHKQESDDVVRMRAVNLGPCTTYILRPSIFTGASMQNYLVGALRGTPTGRGRLAARFRRQNRRLPLVLPRGEKYPNKLFQFVHVDDMARLIAWILRKPERNPDLVILNVAGRGPSITLRRCTEMAGAQVVRLPARFLCRWALQLGWNLGVSGVPPAALPYMIGSYTMDTTRLQEFLGKDYEQVMQYTIEDALADSFRAADRSPDPGFKESVPAG